jgi:hypothetical protein
MLADDLKVAAFPEPVTETFEFRLMSPEAATNEAAPVEESAEPVFNVKSPELTVSVPATVQDVPSVTPEVFDARPTRTDVESDETAIPVRFTAELKLVVPDGLSITFGLAPARVSVFADDTDSFESWRVTLVPELIVPVSNREVEPDLPFSRTAPVELETVLSDE